MIDRDAERRGEGERDRFSAERVKEVLGRQPLNNLHRSTTVDAEKETTTTVEKAVLTVVATAYITGLV